MTITRQRDTRPRKTRIRRRAWWPTAEGWRAVGLEPADPERPRMRLTGKALALLEVATLVQTVVGIGVALHPRPAPAPKRGER